MSVDNTGPCSHVRKLGSFVVLLWKRKTRVFCCVVFFELATHRGYDSGDEHVVADVEMTLPPCIGR